MTAASPATDHICWLGFPWPCPPFMAIWLSPPPALPLPRGLAPSVKREPDKAKANVLPTSTYISTSVKGKRICVNDSLATLHFPIQPQPCSWHWALQSCRKAKTYQEPLVLLPFRFFPATFDYNITSLLDHTVKGSTGNLDMAL